MKVFLEVEGSPEDVAMCTQMLNAMRGLKVTVGTSPGADRDGATAPPAAEAPGASAVDAAVLLPPVQPREPPSKLTVFKTSWMHNKTVFSIIVDDQRSQCVSGGAENMMQVFTESGRLITRLGFDGWKTTTSFDFHPKLGLLVANALVDAGSGASYIGGWTAKDKEGFELRGFSQRPPAAKLSVVKVLPETSGFLSAETSGKKTQDILFWDVGIDGLKGDNSAFSDLRPSLTFRGHTGVVTSLATYPMDPANFFLSGSRDGSIRLWDLRSPEKSVASIGEANADGVVSAHDGGVAAIESSGYLLLSAGSDRKVKVWDMRTKACLASLDGAGEVTCISANSSLRLAALCSPEGVFLLDYAKEGSPVLKQADGYDKTMTYTVVKWNEEAGMLMLGTDCGHVDIYTVPE